MEEIRLDLDTPASGGVIKMLPVGSIVSLQAHAQYRGPLVGLARKLRADGVRIVLYVGNVQQKDYYAKRHGDLFDEIVDANVLYPALGDTLDPWDVVVARAAEAEKLLGTTLGEIAVSDRHLGRGFAVGGYGHPRSRMSETTDHRAMLHGLSTATSFWEREIARIKPALFINADKIPAVLCRRANIPVRVLAGSRYKQYQYWAHDEYLGLPTLAENFERQPIGAEAELEAPYDDHLKWRAHFRAQMSLSAAAKSAALQVARRAWWTVRGYEKAKGYYLREELRHIWRIQADARALAAMTVPLSALAGKPFAYFPLHMEPEIALQQLSPECFVQISVIAAIARDLPAGVTLAVKEIASAIGRRPREFYGQIAEFKNVVMLDVFEHGLEVVKKSGAVCTITGTGGYEGAVLGKPIISFGRRNLYNIVPHVTTVTDSGDIKAPLRHAFSGDFDAQAARSAGARFLRAMVASSFEMVGFTTRNPDVVTEEALEAMYQGLLRSLIC
jgi:hypothetical protein